MSDLVLQVPQISVHDNISVVVSSLVDDLDVVNFTFANTSVCSNFSCFVRCLNDEKTFWICKFTNLISIFHGCDVWLENIRRCFVSCDSCDAEQSSRWLNLIVARDNTLMS